jgi:uncharacterized radical SAM superfamily Fe-S cluster-containing enzyme
MCIALRKVVREVALDSCVRHELCYTIIQCTSAKNLSVITTAMSVERLSIELTHRCSKRCHFCYNDSHPGGETVWSTEQLVSFVQDCEQAGTKAVSLGGGEPLEFEGVFEVLRQLQGTVFRSITSNGLRLQGQIFDRLVAAAPDKVHLSIHFPEQLSEVERVTQQVLQLQKAGIRSGVNLLVAASSLSAAQQTAQRLRDAGIGNDRIVYLPQRGTDTPTPQQLAQVAGNLPFQSMTCLQACAKSSRFCAITWDQQVAWCSYTSARRPLPTLTAAGLAQALTDLPLVYCG